MERNKKIKYIIIALSCLGLIFIVLRKKNEEASIKSNMNMSTAEVKSSRSGHRGGIQIKYSFNFNGKEYEGNTKVLISNAFTNDFLNKKLPVIFDSTDPRKNNLLILPNDFKKYNLQYPDSLHWITIIKDKSL